jgi:hypothetical protein
MFSSRIGRMGYGETVRVTAIGDTVNIASCLQDLTKEYSCQSIVSNEVVAKVGLNTDGFQRHQLTVRNRREAPAIFVVENVKHLDNTASARPEYLGNSTLVSSNLRISGLTLSDQTPRERSTLAFPFRRFRGGARDR